MILGDIATALSLELIGDSSHAITSIASLEDACSEHITFASHLKYKQSIYSSKAGCIIITPELAECLNPTPTNLLISEHPYYSIAQLSQDFKKLEQPSMSISPSAHIDPTARIGAHTIIGMGCVIGKNVVIGPQCHLYPNVTILDGSIIGDNCIISSGTVIGCQGFGNIWQNSQWQNVYHLGRVVISDNVHIGANTTIDKGTFGDTIIEHGVRIDNLVHIAHNVHIGEHTAIAALCGIAGSTVIGKRCKIAGKVGIIGHLNITDDVTIYATSTVHRSITESGEYTSFMPIMTHSKWKKIALHITKFDKICKLLNIKIGKL